MKKIIIIFSSVALLLNTSCNKKENENSGNASQELKMYVDSVKTVSVDNRDSWANIESNYQMKLAKAEAEANDETEKNRIAESKKDFQEYKDKNNTDTSMLSETTSDANENTVDPKSLSKKQEIRDALFGQGKLGQDIKFDWVTSKNILGVYENFVASVKKNKANYSREDWDEVKVLYEALDTRKNEVEKDLATKDNLQIAKRKVEFASYETIDRPMSKVKENEEAKK